MSATRPSAESPEVFAATLTARARAIEGSARDLAVAGVLMGAYGYWAPPAGEHLMPSIFSLAALTGLAAYVVGLAIAYRLRVRAAGLASQGPLTITSD